MVFHRTQRHYNLEIHTSDYDIMSRDRTGTRSFLQGTGINRSRTENPPLRDIGAVSDSREASSPGSFVESFDTWGTATAGATADTEVNTTVASLINTSHDGGQKPEETSATDWRSAGSAGTPPVSRKDSNGEKLLPDCPRSPHRSFLQNQRLVSIHRSASKDHPAADIQPTKENSQGAALTHGIQKEISGVARR
jgi:hypothetical protein